MPLDFFLFHSLSSVYVSLSDLCFCHPESCVYVTRCPHFMSPVSSVYATRCPHIMSPLSSVYVTRCPHFMSPVSSVYVTPCLLFMLVVVRPLFVSLTVLFVRHSLSPSHMLPQSVTRRSLFMSPVPVLSLLLVVFCLCHVLFSCMCH